MNRQSPMEHVDIRAPRASIREWRKRAQLSGMTLSEWLRRVADLGPVFETSITPTPMPLADGGSEI